jgi:hypothetical protein
MGMDVELFLCLDFNIEDILEMEILMIWYRDLKDVFNFDIINNDRLFQKI